MPLSFDYYEIEQQTEFEMVWERRVPKELFNLPTLDFKARHHSGSCLVHEQIVMLSRYSVRLGLTMEDELSRTFLVCMSTPTGVWFK